ncbi:MAG TPA: protein kinase, partial [Vicinamibacterales bacterium]|nr:protein kinase [Vicinamibacterales bacterium]
MPLTPGLRLGPYEIVAAIGEGGMGEVYRARDTALGRDVAVKVLPDTLMRDADRLVRFDREARLLASINHPPIAHVYGVEAWQSSRAIVMELVPGPTLADRIAQGALALDVALPIARQIAGALATANDQGVVHRDLKPSNIKAAETGVVKVLDFGLAKTLLDDPIDGASTVVSPAVTARGVILGTAAYMSPEQARGKAIDKRTDVWAFGCVLYEMLTGARAFPGEDVLDTATAVLKQEPDWSRLPIGTPVAIRALLRRCLAKDRTKRLADLHDAALAIDDVIAGIDQAHESRPIPSKRSPAIGWMVAAAAIAVAGTLGWMRWRTPDPAPQRFDITTPPTTDLTMFALSPEGRRIVFVAYAGPESVLWLRDFQGAGVARPIAGTAGASFPFWSPDGESIGFFADGQLKRVDLGSGTIRNLAAVPNTRGGTWSTYAGGTILYSTGLGIWRVPSNGGTSSQVTKVQEGQSSHRHPQFLQDGHRFFYAAQGNRAGEEVAPGGLYLMDLDGGRTVRLGDGLSQTLQLSDGR